MAIDRARTASRTDRMVKGGERRQNKKARLGLDNARTAGGEEGESAVTNRVLGMEKW